MNRALPDHQEYLDPTKVRRFKEWDKVINTHDQNRKGTLLTLSTLYLLFSGYVEDVKGSQALVFQYPSHLHLQSLKYGYDVVNHRGSSSILPIYISKMENMCMEGFKEV